MLDGTAESETIQHTQHDQEKLFLDLEKLETASDRTIFLTISSKKDFVSSFI